VSAEIIPARQAGHRYEARVGDGVPEALAALARGRDRVAVVSCARVLATPFGRRAVAALRAAARRPLVHALPDRERGKTLRELERGAVALLRAGCTRGSLVVALGGGAVTDAAGMLAATFMRGLDWAAVPTTLLGMVDAALGGKTAVNLPGAKNAVGAFHPPVAVLADAAALATLPRRELASGMGEVVKYAALRPALLARLPTDAGAPGPGLVAECMRIKIAIVERDPREQGERKVLNLGHTYGHGVEAAGGFRKFTHGESVAVGLAFAFRLARRLGRVGDDAVAQLEAALQAQRLPTRIPPGLARRAAALTGFDKKRDARGLRWVLPRTAEGGWQVDWDVDAGDDAVAATVREIGGAR